MQDDRRDVDAARGQAGEDGGGEGTAGARHLGAARLGGEDRLVGREGEAAVDVRVADGRAVAVEVGEQRAVDGEVRDPEARAAVGLEQARGGAGRQREALAGAAVAHPPARVPELHDPAVAGAGRGRGEVEGRRAAVRPPRGECRGEGRRRVHHEQVAGGEEAGEVGEARVARGAGRQAHDQEAHGVARGRRRVGLERRRRRSGRRRATARRPPERRERPARATVRRRRGEPRRRGRREPHAASAAVKRPLGRSSSRRRRSAGRAASGSGRSEMSSPG